MPSLTFLFEKLRRRSFKKKKSPACFNYLTKILVWRKLLSLSLMTQEVKFELTLETNDGKLLSTNRRNRGKIFRIA